MDTITSINITNREQNWPTYNTIQGTNPAYTCKWLVPSLVYRTETNSKKTKKVKRRPINMNNPTNMPLIRQTVHSIFNLQILHSENCPQYSKTSAMITNSWSRRRLTMITASFLLDGVIINVICLHSAMITVTVIPWIRDQWCGNVVVVVVVVMTSPSGTAYMGGQMSRRDEEFHQTLNPEGSVSPSW